jgi:hypothetical protein
MNDGDSGMKLIQAKLGDHLTGCRNIEGDSFSLSKGDEVPGGGMTTGLEQFGE